jgi:hypothetical protein
LLGHAYLIGHSWGSLPGVSDGGVLSRKLEFLRVHRCWGCARASATPAGGAERGRPSRTWGKIRRVRPDPL